MNRAIKERNVCLYALPSAMTAQRGLAVQAEHFESAQAFLFHYEEHKDYDVLLLDIEMPGMDGMSMARAIRRENEAVQIVFITGYSDYIAEGHDVAAGVHYDAQRVRECLKLAGFEERLQKMPKGLDTCLYKDLEQDGVEILGGEAQKIAIARALYKDAPFISLDEPTAALDPIAEAEIYEKFNEIAGDKTAVYISHRLSSCKFSRCLIWVRLCRRARTRRCWRTRRASITNCGTPRHSITLRRKQSEMVKICVHFHNQRKNIGKCQNNQINA